MGNGTVQKQKKGRRWILTGMKGMELVSCIHLAGFLGVITRLRNPLELRFVIHQNPGLVCIWLSRVPARVSEYRGVGVIGNR